MIKSKYLRACLHSLFLILLSLQENQSYVKTQPEPLNKTRNIPWVQNSIVYTQRFHFPNKKDRLTRRSISYHSNIVGGVGINSIDMDKYMYGGRIKLSGKSGSPFNMSNFVTDPNQFTKFSSKEETFTSQENPFLKSNEKHEYSVINTLKRQEMNFMNDVFNYYEKFEDQTFFDNDHHEHPNLSLDRKRKKDKFLTSAIYNKKKQSHHGHKANKDKIKGSFKEMFSYFGSVGLKVISVLFV